jgi:hypothetical protein
MQPGISQGQRPSGTRPGLQASAATLRARHDAALLPGAAGVRIAGSGTLGRCGWDACRKEPGRPAAPGEQITWAMTLAAGLGFRWLL